MMAKLETAEKIKNSDKIQSNRPDVVEIYLGKLESELSKNSDLGFEDDYNVQSSIEDVYVSVPTNVFIGADVDGNKNIVNIYENDNYDRNENVKYSDFKVKLNEFIKDNTLQRNLVFKPYWREGRIKKLKKLSAIDVICANQYSICLGGPGSGKSTFLKYLAVSLIKLYKNKEYEGLNGDTYSSLFFEKNYIPIFVRLREERVQSVSNEDEFLNIVFDGIEYDLDQLKNTIKKSNVIFLFDGADEIFNVNPQRCINQLIGFTKSLNDRAKIVITSRKERINSLPSDFFQFELQIMDNECRNKFVKKILKNDNLCVEFISQLSISDLDEYIIGNPLLLSLIILIFKKQQRLPSNKSCILHDSINLLINRWAARNKKSLDNSGIEKSQLLSVLQDIAYETMLRGNSQLVFDGNIIGNKLMNDYQASQKDAAVLQTCLVSQVGIIREKASDNGDVKCEFAHRYFHEYLAASKLSDMGDELFAKLYDKLGDQYDKFGNLIIMLVEIWHDMVPTRLGMIWQILGFLIDIAKNSEDEEKKDWLSWLCGKILSRRSYVLLESIDKAYVFGIKNILYECNDLLFKSIESMSFELKKKIECARCLWNIGYYSPKTMDIDRNKIGDRRCGVGVVGKEPDIAWCYIKGGRFILGLESKDRVYLDDTFGTVNFDFSRELPPVDNVEVNDFYMSKYPVTMDQYRLFIDDGAYERKELWEWADVSRKWFKNFKARYKDIAKIRGYINEIFDNVGNAPMVNISWVEAKAFCEWLSEKTGANIRLPYETEWEYVAKLFGYGLYSYSNEYSSKYYIGRDIGLKKAAPVGLTEFPMDITSGMFDEYPRDLNGNVWEWTQTIMSNPETLENYIKNREKIELKRNNYKSIKDSVMMVVRGGSFINQGFQSRNSYRGRDYIFNHITIRQGFRLVKEKINEK